MNEVFSLWDSLLKKLTSHQSRFLAMLTDEMLVHLISPSMLDTSIDTYREAITMWLEHIYTTRGWWAAIKRMKLNDSIIMETCLQNPSHWTLHLASTIIESSSHKITKEVYEDRVTKAIEYLKSKSETPIVRSISIENLDRLLPSQREWLDSDEGLAEKSKYLKRTQPHEGQSGQSIQGERPKDQATDPAPDSARQQHGKNLMDMGENIHDDIEEDVLESPEADSEVGGWSQWKGVWTPRPIGMV